MNHRLSKSLTDAETRHGRDLESAGYALSEQRG
jgi:hypothetical protein